MTPTDISEIFLPTGELWKLTNSYHWIGYKQSDPSSLEFPPRLVGPDGTNAPGWTLKNEPHIILKHFRYSLFWGDVWSNSVRYNLKGGKYTHRSHIKSSSTSWWIVSGDDQAGVVCQKDRTSTTQVVASPDSCWTNSDPNYRGNKNSTIKGYQCAKWNDNSVYVHQFLTNENHNYCRNPDKGSGGPWCYTNSSNKVWDYCFLPCFS